MQVRLLLAVALSALASTVSTVSAAPIQGFLNPTTGAVAISGFTGEVFGALRGPENLLLPANAQPNGSYTLDATLPGEIGYLGLSGINGALTLGNVVKPGLPVADLQSLKVAYQLSFTSEIVELRVRFPLSNGTIPAGEAGFFLPFPEPGSFSMLVVAAAAALAANRRRTGRQRCVAVQ